MSAPVPAVERAVRILNALKAGQREYGVSELSQALDINKSTVHGILRTLSEHRVLEQDPQTRKYRLGPGLIELGRAARARRDLQQVARPYLVELMESTQETALLGVFEQEGITIVDRVEPARELHVTAASGQRLPYSAGSFGQAILAWMEAQELDRLLSSRGLQAFTPTSTTDPVRFKQELHAVRQRGYALDDSEAFLEGVWAVSAPIRDTEGTLAALTVVGFSSRMSHQAKRSAIQATVQAARQISLGMGASEAQLSGAG